MHVRLASTAVYKLRQLKLTRQLGLTEMRQGLVGNSTGVEKNSTGVESAPAGDVRILGWSCDVRGLRGRRRSKGKRAGIGPFVARLTLRVVSARRHSRQAGWEYRCAWRRSGSHS